MSQNFWKNKKRIYKLVLTGGPCGGKTTGQARLCTFFENLGWKVYRVPEASTVLLGGGVRFSDLGEEDAYHFQLNLIKTMMQMETTFFDLAEAANQDCLVICDRGAMDASAYLKPEQWERMKREYGWNNVDLRDNRYNQVIHMVSAAKGAEAFYQLANNVTRLEGVDLARKLDDITSQAWVGHPYYDVIDNTTDFERKVVRMIAAVCNRLGVDAGDRLALDSRKRKFLIKHLPDTDAYPKFQDFIVAHDYLVTPTSEMQARIRRRGQNVNKHKNGHWNLESAGFTDNRHVPPYLSSCVLLSKEPKTHRRLTSKAAIIPSGKCFMFGVDKDLSNWTYTHTIRRPKINEEAPEMKMQITTREYELLLAQKDISHYSIYKKRRCFLWNNQYFQMDIYEEPCPDACRGLIILETYTTLKGDELQLPDFLEIDHEITDDSSFSMFNLSKKPASPSQNRMRSYSEGESIGANLKGGKGPGHQKRFQSMQSNNVSLLEGRQDNGQLMNGSANDLFMSCDSSGESS